MTSAALASTQAYWDSQYPTTINPVVVLTITPDNGPAAGPNPVEITGSGFMEAGAQVVQVKVEGVEATQEVLINDGDLTCVLPTHAAGTVAVKVFNPISGFSTALGIAYSYT